MPIVQDEISFVKVYNGQDGVDGIQGEKGDTGIPGPKGEDGKTQYTHIAYSNSIDGSKDFSVSDSNRDYIGMYVDFIEKDSTVPSDYAWSLIKGADGTQGTPGKAGADGKTPYFHTAWANSADGKTDFSTTVSAGKKYLGTYTDYVSADSTDATKYSWSLIKGEDGKTSYIHKAWAWSSDGTDRFTGVYPNENLANGQKINADGTGYYDSKTFLARGTIETSTEIINEGAPTYKTSGAWSAMCFKTDGLKITDIGTKLVFSEYFYNLEPNTVEVRFYCDGMKRSGFSYFLPSQVWTRITVDTEIVSKPIGFMRIEAITSSKLIRGNIKVEYDANSTVFTPSPQDDFNNAYPTFEGYYSSFSPTPSTNPSDYTWSRIRGNDGQNGQDGVTPKDVISGYLTNESLIVPANPSGVVSSYANAYGDFVVYEGQTKLNSGVTYSKVSETGMTSTINSAGRYTMTALTTDTAMAIYRATYSGVSIDKIVIAVKNKQGATGQTGSAGTNGTNGKDGATGPQGPPTGVTTQATVPTSPYVGMLWQNTGTTSGYIPGATYQWNGSKWNLYIFVVENILATHLSAISANLGNITAGTLDGAKIISRFNRDLWSGSALARKGQIEISNGLITLDYDEYLKTNNTVQAKGSYILNEEGFSAIRKAPDGTLLSAIEYDSEGIYMEDTTFSYGKVDLTYEDLMSIPETMLTPSSGFSIYGDTPLNKPTAKRKLGMITLSGAFKNNTIVGASTTETVMGKLPEWAIPESNQSFVCQGSGINRYFMVVRTDGTVSMTRYGAGALSDTPVGSWLNISAVYAGKNTR